MSGTHILWACGFLAFAGLPGFASSESLAQIQRTNDSRYADDLDTQITNFRIQQCDALFTVPKNKAAADGYWSKIKERMDRWYEIKRYPYNLPPCHDL